jgi:site-specific DNA-methyltransferase (adenine-specific)
MRKGPERPVMLKPAYVCETSDTHEISVVNLLLAGDCLEYLPQFPRGVYDTVFVDPPFNIGYAYDDYDDDRPRAEYLEWCAEWLDLCHSKLKPQGTLWLAMGPRFYPEVDAVAKSIGFHRRSTVIWHYTFGVANTKNFSLGYTNLAYYTKHKAKFHFDADICRVPSARQLVYNDRRANPKGKLPDDVWFYRPQDLPGGLPADGDVWHAPRVAGTFKSRQAVANHMPEQVVARCLRTTTPAGGLVLDPMAGSGTTPAVCRKLGFRYTAIELSEDYAAKMVARVGAAGAGDPLDGPAIQD